MPKYRATVQLSGLTGETPRAVRAALDERLRKSGFEQCRVIALDIDAPFPKRASPRPSTPVPVRRSIDAGGLLLVGAVAWAIWFFWMMLSSITE